MDTQSGFRAGEKTASEYHIITIFNPNTLRRLNYRKRLKTLTRPPTMYLSDITAKVILSIKLKNIVRAKFVCRIMSLLLK